MSQDQAISLTEEKLQDFRKVVNGVIYHFFPDIEPGDSINFSQEQLRFLAEALGHFGTGREVEAYLYLEIEKWKEEPIRSKLLADLMAVVQREIELLEFYPANADRERTHPLPAQVTVLNLDGGENKQMPTEEFIKMLEGIRNSSVFKR